MQIYLLNILLTTVLAIFAQYFCFVKTIGRSKKEVSLFFIAVILIIWSIIYAYRGASVGSDTEGYMEFYKLTRESPETYIQFMQGKTDRLFESLRYFCAKVLNKDWVFFSFVTAIVTYLPILLVVKKEASEYFCFSLLIYIFLLKYCYGFNATRQAMAVGMTFLGYNLFFKRNQFLAYALCILVAFGFHSTAIFAIPFHLASRLKLHSKVLWVILIILFTSAFALKDLWDIAIKSLAFVGNDLLAERYANSTYLGSGYLRVIVCVCPVIIGIWKYQILKLYDDHIDQSIIMLLFSVVLMLFSTQNWLFGRIAEYCSIFAILFVPKLQYVFVEKSKFVAKLLIGGLYFAYMIALLLHGDGGFYPYVFYG